MSNNIEYVPKKEVKEYKREMYDYLCQASKNLKEKEKTGFNVGIVGSAKRNLVLRRGEEIYDVDFQLILHRNNQGPEYREDIYEELREIIPEHWSLSQSTSTIFCTEQNNKEFDIALIKKMNNDNFQISKLDKKNEDGDKYIWNIMRDTKDIYKKRNEIKGIEEWEYLRDEYKQLRENEWDKNRDEKKPSYSLFSEAINNTYNHFHNQNK